MTKFIATMSVLIWLCTMGVAYAAGTISEPPDPAVLAICALVFLSGFVARKRAR